MASHGSGGFCWRESFEFVAECAGAVECAAHPLWRCPCMYALTYRAVQLVVCSWRGAAVSPLSRKHARLCMRPCHQWSSCCCMLTSDSGS